ncbi:MAG TPA: efflux RND transporter periplasmic adaptor subunit [Alphaproteobacteria bacterium]|nr:efflux RND transporter periplasmic adaptor subunit [Alphaproteobacteria bacterium]
MARINDRLTAIGEGEAARSVTVVAPSTGTLERLNVRPGDSVTAGTVIGNLDADGEQIAYDRAVLAKQDADAALARTQELVKSSAATTVQLNAAQLAADNAQLELATAELALRKRTIVSPIDGTVGLFQVGPGNAVSPQSVVTTIEDNSHIVVSFWVPERYATAILPGMPVQVAAVAMPGETLEGEVTALDNRIDPASRTLKVQARVGNANGTLRPGMSFQVSLRFPGETFAAVDPLAIQWSSDGAYVWKLMDGKVDRALVEIIQRNSDGVLVKGDLAPGDQVVTQGVQQLTAGASVRLLDGDARPAAREEEVGS